MFKAPLIALSAAGPILSAGPALAKAPKSDEPTTRMTVMQKDGQTVYCVRQNVLTGTILSGKICKSREEWAAAGLNIPAAVRSADGDSVKSGGATRLNP